MTESPLNRLTSGRLLARNTVLNLVGYAAPLLIAVFAVPLLINGLGTARFGVLTLVWALVGYFSLFDLGMGRALVKMVAEKLGEGQEHEVPALVWTGSGIMISIGLVGTVSAVLVSPWLVRDALQIPVALQTESLYASYLLALSIPMVIGTAALRGVLEAQQRFDLVNAVRVPMSAFNFGGPLIVLPFSHSLTWMVAVLVAGRLAGMLIHLLLCFHTIPALRMGVELRLALIKPLFRLGGWMTVAHSAGAILVNLDRFVIGALVSATAVAYYATPSEIVAKLWIVPEASIGVLFAAFSASYVRDKARAKLLFGQGVKYIFLFVFPIALVIVTLSYEGLALWLGSEFARESAPVMQWLAIGTLINTLTFVPYAFVQSAGRPHLTAIVHLIEPPLYVVMAWWLIGSYGIMGAAAAFVVRVLLDALVMFGLVRYFLEISPASVWRSVLIITCALLTMVAATFLSGVVVKGAFLVSSLSIFALSTWYLILASEEKRMVRDTLKILRLRVRT